MVKQSTILQKRFFCLPFNECGFSYKIFSHTWLAISSVDFFFVHGITIIFIQILINIVIVIIIIIIIIINTKKL